MLTLRTYVAVLPGVSVAGLLFATPTSLIAVMVVVAVAVLFAVLVSVEEVVAVATFVIVVPLVRPLAVRTIIVKVAFAPALKAAIEQFTVPVEPAAGVVHVNAGPDV